MLNTLFVGIKENNHDSLDFDLRKKATVYTEAFFVSSFGKEVNADGERASGYQQSNQDINPIGHGSLPPFTNGIKPSFPFAYRAGAGNPELIN